MVFVKKLSFLPCAFFRQTKGKKIVFLNILDRKEYFLQQKREFSKMCTKSEFFNGVSPWIFVLCVLFLANQGRKDRFLIFRI